MKFPKLHISPKHFFYGYYIGVIFVNVLLSIIAKIDLNFLVMNFIGSSAIGLVLMALFVRPKQKRNTQ